MIHEVLKRLRHRAGLTMAEASELVGIHITTMYEYERGLYSPSPYRLGLLLDAYGATPGERLDAFEAYASRPRRPRAARDAAADDDTEDTETEGVCA